MAESSNTTLEMGTSDQVLVATKRKKNITYIAGGVAMMVVIGVVIALVVVLSGNEGGVAEEIVDASTVGPTTPISTSTPSSTTSTTTTVESTTTTTQTPETEPPEEQIELEDVINGVFAAPSFNGTWTSGSEVMYRNSNGDLILYDIDTDSITPLVANSSQILQQSARVTQLSPDKSQVLLAYNVAPVYRHSFLARYASIDIVSGEVNDILPPGLNSSDAFLQNFVWGPSGTAFAFVYLNNIYYQADLNSDPRQITATGVLNVVYHGIPDWVYEEEVFSSNNALWFSADGSKLAYATFDDTNVRIMNVPHYGVPGSVAYQYTQHHAIRYPKSGTTNPTVSVTLHDLTSNTGASTVYDGPSDLEQPILRNVRFVSNDALAVMWTNRVQNQMVIELCSLGTSACSRIFSYNEPEGWIDNIPLIFNEQGNSFVTILPQTVDGVRYKQIVQVTLAGAQWTARDRTNTPHTVGEILTWTPNDVIWYKATSINDSSEQHIYTVTSEGLVTCFTCSIRREDGGECLYNDATFSTGAARVTVNCAGPDIPQVYIFDTNGSLVLTWDNNEETVAAMETRTAPQTIRLSVPVADGLPNADVLIQAPANFEQRTNVPLLVYVYGGPESSLVTKQWNIDWGSSLVSRWNIAIAHIDGRGSGLRGVANTFALNRKLGSVEIDDQINVTRYIQENLNWIDSNRTCIWGWSYGGYAASLALARGGSVFRCGIAVAPVVDWRFYDTIYTERYMDVPVNNSQAYADSSLLTEEVVDAFRQKRYFLVHGTADDNVHYQHAMLISRLLQRQDVYFTQMSYTDEDHGLVGVRPHLYHALEKYLEENML